MIKNAFILNFFKFYNILWRLSLPFLVKNKRLKNGFEKRIASSHHARADIWIQASSAGEAYLAVSIFTQLEPRSKTRVLFTATTSQGIDILKSGLSRREYNPLIHLTIELFPFDMPATIKEAVRIINPGIMVLLETEIWPALLYYLKENQTKIFIINARLSRKSFTLYRKTRFLWNPLAPDIILATSDQDAQRYKQIFKPSVVRTMKNIKFESMGTSLPDSDTRERIRQMLPKDLPLTILASIRSREKNDTIALLKEILTTFPDQVVAIFPRHMHRIRAWEKALSTHGFKFHLRSEVRSLLTGPGIILWDTFGELKTAYGFAAVVFVGGSLKPLGGQNFIEPAIDGAVTVTGPYYDDFAWATDDIFNTGIVIKENNWKAAARKIITALENPGSRTARKDLAQKYLIANRGGTRQACNEILSALKT